jgi:hypothetical protein
MTHRTAQDLTILGGVALLLAGLWLIHPGVALVVGGLVMAGAGLWLRLRQETLRQRRGE